MIRALEVLKLACWAVVVAGICVLLGQWFALPDAVVAR